MMKKYTLYLDESQTKVLNRRTRRRPNPHFCMAGIIIEDKDFANLEKSVNQFKRGIWPNEPSPEAIILHQMKIIQAKKGQLDPAEFPEYVQFAHNANLKKFYNGLKQVFAQNNITIIGCCISEVALRQQYSISSNKPDPYLIAIQFIQENYCHFLCANNGRGQIIYESRDAVSDERLRDRYYHVKLMGSMYMSREMMAGRLLGLDFVKKSENNAALQVADFVPFSFARHYGNMKQPKYNIFSTLQYHRYDGGMGLPDKFGVKYMP